MLRRRWPSLKWPSAARAPCHRWYRSVLAFPNYIARQFIEQAKDGSVVLDPFVGTGTTCIEAKMAGHRSIGIDAVPFFVFASKVKTDWRPDPRELREVGGGVLKQIERRATLLAKRIDRDATWTELPPKSNVIWNEYLDLPGIIPTRYLSPLVYAQSVMIRDSILDEAPRGLRDHLLLCATRTLLRGSRITFGPEISQGLTPRDFDTLAYFGTCVGEMASDLTALREIRTPPVEIFQADSRELASIIPDGAVDMVITSPPYPVDKDYTRQARIELVFLEHARSALDLQRIKRSMLRASTRQIYSGDADARLVQDIPEIRQITSRIVSRCRRDGDSSGFSRMYPRLVGEYFGGLYRHLLSLGPKLSTGAICVYVLGESRSFKQVYIRTPEIFGLLAEKAGYTLTGMKLLRTRRSTTLRKPLREVAVILTKGRNN